MGGDSGLGRKGRRDVLHADANARAATEGCQVFLKTLSITGGDPSFWGEGVGVGEDGWVLVDEFLG